MKLLPYDKYLINSNKSVDEIASVIDGIYEEWRPLIQYSKMPPSFYGKRIKDKYILNRVIKYRNSFSPLIVITLEQKPTGTNISITIRLSHVAYILIFLWMFYAAVGLVNTVLNNGPYILSIIILIMSYIIVQFGFWFEVPKIKAKLNREFFS